MNNETVNGKMQTANSNQTAKDKQQENGARTAFSCCLLFAF